MPFRNWPIASDNDISNFERDNDTLQSGNQEDSFSTHSFSSDIDFPTVKGLKIANLNVNSLTKHIDEMRVLLAENPFDILSINESKIDWSISDSEIFICNYTMLRHDRTRQGVGVALYIKNNIPFLVGQDLVSPNLEMLCVEINKKFSRPFLISTWYRPPNSEVDLFNNFELFLLKCDMEDKEMILMGNLNCDLKRSLPDQHTSKLLSLCSLYELTQVISEPTRITESTSTLIDLTLTNTPEHILSSGVIPTGVSDQNLVYAVRNFKLPKFKPTLKEVRDFKHFSETQLRNDLLQVSWVSIPWCEDPNGNQFFMKF